jgi:hypothetical protein
MLNSEHKNLSKRLLADKYILHPLEVIYKVNRLDLRIPSPFFTKCPTGCSPLAFPLAQPLVEKGSLGRCAYKATHRPGLKCLQAAEAALVRATPHPCRVRAFWRKALRAYKKRVACPLGQGIDLRNRVSVGG